MPRAKRIFFVADAKNFTNKLLHSPLRKQVKGFIRLGHDTQVFSYGSAFWQTAPVLSKILKRRWCKPYVDELLVKQIKNYKPDIVCVSFANFLDAGTVRLMRQCTPDAFFIGLDLDLWPEYHPNRIEAAKQLDMVATTYAGSGIDAYRKAGVKCAFVPNMCDPDVEYRYEVDDEWKSDILFTGKSRFRDKRYPTEDIRYRLITRLAKMENCRLYGCNGQPRVGGINYLYTISGARIGLSVNAVNNITLYHSARLTTYLACGTFVLAKYVPDSDLLFKDGVHLKYFDTVEDFFELADRYLKQEDQRRKIADAGMHYIHTEFNCEKIAKYIMNLIENGTYSAPWTS
ncbi:MAG: glycosyltransferase family protein [Planctomycetota bacterium]|jgi:spore maturation protein CgeB